MNWTSYFAALGLAFLAYLAGFFFAVAVTPTGRYGRCSRPGRGARERLVSE
ncbi:TPA: hypothetical protein ACKR06_004395 [Pseudomonas aeruginosa]|nr:hypothetical protein [Pseudomonas aeruginosa]HEK0344926.1 hypothetical protein [Pseudomonas aeruginosa]